MSILISNNLKLEKIVLLWISSLKSLSCVRFFVTPWTATHQASLFITNSWSLLKFMSIESLMPSNHLILCHALLLPPSTPFPFNVISRCLSLVQFSCSVMSDSLRPHGLQHSRFLCPSPAPGACSNSCPLSW